MPQTGSLNWPVPVLIGGGVILIAAGWRVSRKEK
ncbi:LPXTG cell wall anchor domain-containing protein [Ruminococcus bicirculans (ex Wegman et al. 2014)]